MRKWHDFNTIRMNAHFCLIHLGQSRPHGLYRGKSPSLKLRACTKQDYRSNRPRWAMNSLRTAANHSSRGWPAATLWPRSPCCWARFYTYIPYRYTTLLYYFTIHEYCKSLNSWRRVRGDGQSEDSPMDRSQPTRRCSFACTKKGTVVYRATW